LNKRLLTYLLIYNYFALTRIGMHTSYTGLTVAVKQN